MAFALEKILIVRYNILRESGAAKRADVAQLAEQLICNQQVEGSSPPVGSR